MPAEDYFTFHDALSHLTDYARANPSNQYERFTRRAVFSAMQELAHAHHWSFFYQVGRVNTVAPYSTGTVVYDHSGGAYERMLTLTDGTFPGWAAYGTVIIGEVQYQVADRINASILQLSVHSNPGTDITDASSYTLMRDRYLLPHDFWTLDDLAAPTNWRHMQYRHPRDWVQLHRYITSSSNTPVYYSVIGSEDFQGCMDLVFYPHPDQAMPIDFLYTRRMRQINTQDYHAGTVTTSDLSKVVTGDGTAFTSSMVGGLIRVADATSRELPTGRDGANPYSEQRTVMTVQSATQLTVDFDFTASRPGAKYVISDPIDIEYGVMKTAFLRCCENQFAKMTRMGGAEGVQGAEQEYRMAVMLAKEADSRSTAPRAVGDPSPYRPRLAHMPMGADVE